MLKRNDAGEERWKDELNRATEDVGEDREKTVETR